MTRVLIYWPHLVLAGCLALAAALAFWPASAKTQVRKAEPAYSGGLFQPRRTSEESGFPFRSGAIDAASGPSLAPAPALVGVAGGAAYLRSAVTGEVGRFSPGAMLDGWRISAVGRRHVIIAGATGDQRLELFSAAAEGATAPPATQVAPSAVPNANPLPIS